MIARVLTDEQRTAALLVYLFAVLHFDSSEWWYEWTTSRVPRAKSRLEAAVWWALRYESDPERRGSGAEDWLRYLEHVYSTQRWAARDGDDR